MARIRPKQAFPDAGALVTIYTCPEDDEATSSTLMICNQSGSEGTFRVAIAPEGADDAREHYIYYDEPLRAKRSFAVTIGMTFLEGDEVRVQSSGLMSFSFFGREEAAA